MLRADVVVVEPDRLVLGEREHPLRAVVESVEGTHQRAFDSYIEGGFIWFRLYVETDIWTCLGQQSGALGEARRQTETASLRVDAHDLDRQDVPDACTLARRRAGG